MRPRLGASMLLHVTWIGLSGQPDRSVARYAIENERTLVTNDAVDFRRIYEKKELHPGIVFLTFSDWRLMDLDGQVLTFQEALDEIERDFPVNELIEVELGYDGDDLALTVSRSPLPDGRDGEDRTLDEARDRGKSWNSAIDESLRENGRDPPPTRVARSRAR
jgi:predicted nuclease of predicted toxin-antitoxin system